MPILREALGYEAVLPLRTISSYEEFITNFPEIEDVYIDGTEIPTQRSSNYDVQKEHFYGKNKTHTHKNIVLSDSCRRILLLSDTQP
jgi:hypothetical protein